MKRYIAPSMRVALDQVRAEQGADAVILSTRRVSEGIEVIAAVDYDEALIAGAARQYSLAAAVPAAPTPAAAPARTASVAPAVAAAPATVARAAAPAQPRPAAATSARPAAPSVARPAAVAARAAPPTAPSAPTAGLTARAAPTAGLTARAAPPTAARTTPDETRRGFASMQRELKDLRRLLESELAGMAWHDRRLREPLKARVLEELAALDIAPDVAASLAALTPARTNVDDPSKIPLALLLRHIPVVDGLGTVTSGVFAVVGPTGAGKTTTIAKLAARWTMQHGSRDLALVSTDAYRIGAREQLMTYARVLGAAMHAPNSGSELERVLERLKNKRLVLIDTAGMGPRDVRLAEQLAALKAGAARARFLLALPAHGEAHALEEIMRAFVRVSPAACIITKVDEAASLGAVLSTTLRHKLRIAYLCNGQRVPEDVHSAHRRRVWLVRAAHTLKQRASVRRDEGYYVRQSGRVPAHA